MNPTIPHNKIHAVAKVSAFFKKHLANFDGVLCYTGETFMIPETDKAGKKCWKAISDSTADVIILRNLDNWYGPENFIEDEYMDIGIKACPVCKQVNILDALSRKDNKLSICTDCGTAEALEDMAKFNS